MLRERIIAGSIRTPIGSFMGSLSKVSAAQLGSYVIKEALFRAQMDGQILDEVIMGQVITAGMGQSPGRQAALMAGVPEWVPAYTVNNVCGSGLRTVMMAATNIRAGQGRAYVAGGMENMSMAPYVDLSARSGHRLGHANLQDTILSDALWDKGLDIHMGVTAEYLVGDYQLSRLEQDQFAYESQMKAAIARTEGRFVSEILPIEIKSRNGSVIVDRDEYIKPETTLEILAKLRPAFTKDGSVTAGNASGINDGAAAMVVMDRALALQLEVPAQAKIVAYAVAGHDPSRMGLSPVFSTRKVLEMTGMTIDDIDLIEANEAFAAQSLAVGRELKWNPEKVNVNGGAIALGHPVGASGSRILVTLIHALKDRGLEYGLATLCVGGGMGLSMIIQNLEK